MEREIQIKRDRGRERDIKHHENSLTKKNDKKAS